MKLPFRLFALLSVIVTISGCATQIQKRETLLTSSGFRTKPATTPQQIAMLGKLPTDKITPISHHGHVLFVYPDVSRDLLYVGSPTEYATYKKARLEKKLEIEEPSATFQQQAGWSDMDGWKGLSDGWYNF